MVIVEAAEGSGSLITADFALEQGRAVLAVPGNVLGGRNYGAHALLRDGAKFVECADDILEELPSRLWDRDGDRGRARQRIREPRIRVSGSSAPVDGRRASRTISTRSRSDRASIAMKLLPRLLELELAGAVRRVEGGRFVRFRGPC